MFQKKPQNSMAKKLETLTKTKVNPKIVAGVVILVVLIGLSFIGSTVLMPTTGTNNTNGPKYLPPLVYGTCYETEGLACGFDVKLHVLDNQCSGNPVDCSGQTCYPNLLFCPDGGDCCDGLKSGGSVRSPKLGAAVQFLNSDGVFSMDGSTESAILSCNIIRACDLARKTEVCDGVPAEWKDCTCRKVNCNCDAHDFDNKMKTLIKQREGMNGTVNTTNKTITSKIVTNDDGTTFGVVCWGHKIEGATVPQVFSNYPTICQTLLDDDYNKFKGKASNFACPDGRMSFNTFSCATRGALVDLFYQKGNTDDMPKFTAALCSCNWAEAKKQTMDVKGLGHQIIDVLLNQGSSCGIPSSI